jgi:hypothetical protein
VSEWRPIETAPKDGTAILIFEPSGACGLLSNWHMPPDGPRSYRLNDPRLHRFDDYRFAIGYWRPRGGWGNRNSAEVNPTHWMPLPSPPEPPDAS